MPETSDITNSTSIEDIDASTVEEMRNLELSVQSAMQQSRSSIDRSEARRHSVDRTNEDYQDLNQELEEIVELSGKIKINETAPKNEQAEINWLLEDDDSYEEEGWGTPGKIVHWFSHWCDISLIVLRVQRKKRLKRNCGQQTMRNGRKQSRDWRMKLLLV